MKSDVVLVAAALALAAAGPIARASLSFVRYGTALSVFSGNAVGAAGMYAACAYMVAYLASWLLTPTILLSLLVHRWLGWAIARYSARSR
jgi:hypothetical protein